MRIIALIIYILLALPALAQQQPSRSDLEKRRQSIMESIRITEQQLEATKKDKNATMGQLRALKSKLAERQRLINNMNEEIDHINNNIKSSSNEVTKLQQNLEVLKMRYAQSVRYAYKTRSSYDMLAFLFSSDDFNEAMRRLKYLKKYRDYRKRQAEDIRLTQNRIENKITDLNHQKSEKDVLLTAEEQQKKVLQNESNETNQVVLQLKGKERELMNEIAANKKSAKQLDRAVAEIIRREMEIARKKAEEEQRRRAEEEARRAAANTGGYGASLPGGRTTPANNTSKPPAGSTAKLPGGSETNAPVASARPKPAPVSYNLSMTPEAAALSSSFENNRGRLPWPVEKGFISDAFGTHRHPVAEKVMIENNGVDITTSNGATARAVFEGTVSKVFYIPGMEWNVLVNHGRYFTLYSKLANVTVKNNQDIKTKQVIGTVSNNEEGQAVMNFQVWKDGAKMDPAGWIAR
ncbi:MAG: peptidase M23 [Sphingobacteriales bacterium]|nr:MAG: peptidase M23 [Sphingobacteriales bacterium]